jgi:predicted P-loop ATPase
MVQARSDRRVRRGETALDVDEEVAKLLRPQVDPGLREEVRQLVVARNERRLRQGKEPLDVEAEIDRQLKDLT